MTSIDDTSRVLVCNHGLPWRISCMRRAVQVTGLVPRQEITGSKWLQEEIKRMDKVPWTTRSMTFARRCAFDGRLHR